VSAGGLAALVAVALLALAAVPASAAGPPSSRLVVPERFDAPPPGWRMTAATVIARASALPRVSAGRAGARTFARAYQNGPRRWRVAFFRRGPERTEVAQVAIDDRTGRVLEAWTGVQVDWIMARGYPGAFGRSANAPWLWIGLSLLFLLPFARPPLRLVHLDLAVLLAFGISYAAFNAARIDVSVPSAYPGLAYLLVRMLVLAAARGRPGLAPARSWLSAPVLWRFTAGLIAFRVALNVVDGNVIDVGYSGVIGADRITGAGALYGGFPIDVPHGDTYGPILYALYVPFELLWPWSGRWDALPAAHAAAVAFDLVCVALLWALGRRLGGARLGALLPYLWVSYPFTLLVSNSSANEALPAALVLLALLVADRPAARGAAVVAAGLTKFAPLALVPLLIAGRQPRRALAGATAMAVLVLGPLALTGQLDTFWRRTIAFQADRGSPFSLWGLYDGLDAVQVVVQLAAVALALAVVVRPRRRDLGTVAALAAAVLIATQLGVDHWFYLYLVWFAPLVWIALLAPQASGRSTDSIASARRRPDALMSTALSQGSSSAAS
jgi:hypothetical protein